MAKKARSPRGTTETRFAAIVVDELSILDQKLEEASKWIAITKSGVLMVKGALDDFYRACLYFVAKAYAKGAGFLGDASVDSQELEKVLDKSDVGDIIRRLVASLSNPVWAIIEPKLKVTGTEPR